MTGQVSLVIGYGLIYGHTEVLPALETSYTLVASLIAGDTPLQISWHLNGARRRGATVEQVKGVREISIAVAQRCGVVWSNEVPEVAERVPEDE
jgi:endoribonuclease Dicer